MQYASLWLACIVCSVVLLGVAEIPVAVSHGELAIAVATTGALVGLALLHLGIVRFAIVGHPLDLFTGLAFGVLALANLVVRVLGPVADSEPSHQETTLLLLLARVIAVGLLLVGLADPDAMVERGKRRAFATDLGALVALVAGAGTAVILVAGERLPIGLDASSWHLLLTGQPIPDVLSGQHLWLVLTNAGLAMLFALTALGFWRHSCDTADLHHRSIAVALTLLSFSQFHALFFPPVALGYVSSSDGFRLAAYLVLLFGLVSRIGGEIAGHAAHAERLRLSRELHDGLTQHLILLRLRLSRAGQPGRSASQRSGDLQAAQRLVETALLEARQAVTALRTGTVSGEEFTRAVQAFMNEFAQNYEAKLRLLTRGNVPPMRAELQAEVLRIIQESCSNALRHGAATEVDITLAADPGELAIEIRDNGLGFDPAHASGKEGVGLRSLRERVEQRGGTLVVASSVGNGASLRARIPIARDVVR